MFNAKELFKERFTAHIRELNRYLRYIFNGHIAVALLFLTVALSYYYQQWLEQLPANFPAAYIIGIIFGFVVIYNPIQTLLKEPDLVFITVVEEKMHTYFRRTLWYSYFSQLYIVLLASAVLGPLYSQFFSGYYLHIVLLLFLLKGCNLLITWWMNNALDSSLRRGDWLLRFLLNSSLFFLLLEEHFLLAGIVFLLLVGLAIYAFLLYKKEGRIHWAFLVEQDQGRMQSFYRLANLFTEVPHLKARVKKRTWLVAFIHKFIPFQQKYTFDYLYRTTFLRSGDYLGTYVRLMVLGILAIYFIPNLWGKLLIALLFLYLSGFQMTALYLHHRVIMWLDLYPVKEQEKRRAFMKWLYELAFLKVLVFSLVLLVQKVYIGFLLALVSGVVLTVLLMNGYVKRKILQE